MIVFGTSVYWIFFAPQSACCTIEQITKETKFIFNFMNAGSFPELRHAHARYLAERVFVGVQLLSLFHNLYLDKIAVGCLDLPETRTNDEGYLIFFRFRWWVCQVSLLALLGHLNTNGRLGSQDCCWTDRCFRRQTKKRCIKPTFMRLNWIFGHHLWC